VLSCRGESKLHAPWEGANTSKSIVAVRQLNGAPEALPSLSAFEHKPNFWYDGWASRWRDLYFHPYSILDQTDFGEDEDVEGLRLSVVLHSVAYLRVPSRTLTLRHNSSHNSRHRTRSIMGPGAFEARAFAAPNSSVASIMSNVQTFVLCNHRRSRNKGRDV
jgi:hypothetical protein